MYLTWSGLLISLIGSVTIPVMTGRPVEGDGEEVEDGGGAAEDVAGGPHVTQERAEDPGATYLNQGKVGQLFYLVTDEGKVQIN